MEKTIWEQFLDHVEPHLPEYLHWNEICWTFVYYLAEARRHIHRWCRGMEAWEIVVNTVTYCFFVWLAIEVFRWVLYWIFFQDESFPDRVKRSFFRIVRQLPIVKDKIAAEMQKSKDTMQEVAFPERKGEKYYTMLPPKGLKEVALMDEIEDYLKIGDVDWNEGKVSGTVYNGSKDLTRILTTVYSKFAWSNPLHPDIFPGVRKMEAEVVQMCLDLFNGGKDSCGTMTIGGTESILMACKAYRGLAYERGIKKPEIVAPLSIHAAFDKAAHYFGIKLVHVPLEENTMKCNLRALRRAITRSTIAIAGSAPQYPHGVIDPIEEMAALAKKYNLGLHVDCCLGGFVVPFMKKAGYQVAPFDFSVEGVTSISVDTHKYGNCPKGSSVIMYSNKPLRRHQYFVAPNWQGGIYACPTVPGSRAGGIIAATWASLIFHGMSGYVECTRNIIQARLRIEEGLKKIKDIFVFGKPDVSVVAFGSKKFDIFSLSNEMGRRGWHLNPLQFPPGVHICITNLHTKPGVVDRFIKDVKESAAIVMKNPNATTTGVGAIYGMAQSIPDRSMVSELACEFLDSIYTIPLDRPKHKAKEK